MTNKECKIKNLRQNWGGLLLEKESLIKKIWDVEYKLNLIKENLMRYGISETDPELGSDKTEMGKSDYLNDCFAHNSSASVHEL